MQLNMLLTTLAPIGAAFIVYGIGHSPKESRKTLRDYAAWAVVIIEFLLVLTQFVGFCGGAVEYTQEYPAFGGLGLYFKMDGFRALYTTVAAFMWMVCTIFSREYNAHHRNRNRYNLFLLWTLGATIGVFLSADLRTTFLFFEMASLTSYVWVAQEENKGALKAAETYLAIAVIGGLVMLMGLFLLYDLAGTLNIDALRGIGSVGGRFHGNGQLTAAALCIFFGFAAKAGAAPIHIWLPKAHPVAPAPASALLSGMLTKMGIFGILVVSSGIFYGNGNWGAAVLVIGMATMAIGAILAVFSIDMKRVLACSSVSQIGFILIGVAMQGMLGEENGLAVRGTILYMVNHSLFKLVLFLTAGIVFMNIHNLDLNRIRGFGRRKPYLHVIYALAAMGIAGVPGLSGYVSKTLVHESMVEYMELLEEGHITGVVFGVGAMKAFEWLFLICGGMTLCYMLKLYFCLFVEKNADPALQADYENRKRYIHPLNATLIGIAASLSAILGIGANAVFDRLADMSQSFCGLYEFEEKIEYFSLTNLKGSMISLAIGVILYFGFVRNALMRRSAELTTKGATGAAYKEYVDLWPEWLDLEMKVYRPLLKLLTLVFAVVFRFLDKFMDTVVIALRKTVYRDSELPTELSEGTAFTHNLGRFLDWIYSLRHKSSAKGNGLTDGEGHVTYEHRLALAHDKFVENRVIVTRSLSFGLLCFCIGLVLTILYMLYIRR